MQFKDHSRFLEVLLDTIPNPVFYKNRAGTYIGCNQAFCNYLGLTRPEILGKSVYDISPKDLADVYYRADEDLFQAKGVQIYEGKVQTGDWGVRSVIFHKKVFFDDGGNLAGLIGVMVDITTLRELESEFRSGHLLSDDQYSRLNELVRQLEHDIRSPLTVLHMLSTEFEKTAHKDLLGQCAERIDGLVQSIRKQVRELPSRVSQPVDMVKLVANLVEEKRKQFPHGAPLNFEPMPSVPKCLADRTEVERGISNLINNAVEATGEKRSPIGIQLKSSGPWVVLSICDEAGGISPELLPTLGQKGATHNKVSGSGLGIYQADRAVRASGGSLKISSTWGKGTTVEIKLPAEKI